MSWLKTRAKNHSSFPAIYLLALAVIGILAVFWFSLKPAVNARDFLPEQTVFYWSWTDSSAWKRTNDWPLKFSWAEPREQLDRLQDSLAEKFSQLEEIIWFQLDDNQNDNFLFKFRQSLSKKELAKLNTDLAPARLTKISHRLYLLSPDLELPDRLPKVISEKFLLAGNDRGINVFFTRSSVPVWLQPLADLLADGWQREIFINFDLSSRLVNIYQLAEASTTVDAWTSAQLPDKFESVIVVNSDQLPTTIKEQLLPRLLVKSPSDYWPQFNDYLNKAILIQQADKWLIIGRQDWQPLMNQWLLEFGVEEKAGRLPDKTAYVELVKKKDTNVANLEFVGHQYWQIGDWYGMTLSNYYYLSNSEDLIRETVVSRQAIDYLWQGCLPSEAQVSDLLYLGQEAKEKLNFGEFLSVPYEDIALFSYQTDQISGLKLCY